MNNRSRSPENFFPDLSTLRINPQLSITASEMDRDGIKSGTDLRTGCQVICTITKHISGRVKTTQKVPDVDKNGLQILSKLDSERKISDIDKHVFCNVSCGQIRTEIRGDFIVTVQDIPDFLTKILDMC